MIILLLIVFPYIFKHFSPWRHRTAVNDVAAAPLALEVGRLSGPFLCAETKHKITFNIVIINIFKDKMIRRNRNKDKFTNYTSW